MIPNVLLVDDEIITNIVHKSVLERTAAFGYIESACHGRQAIAFLENAISQDKPLPDYIFLDINMPVMNGFQFLEEINNHFAIDRRIVKIIVLSSSIDPKDREKARILGADHFLSKPLGTADILNILNQNGKILHRTTST
jgi:CheY-like chemotaxis protein